MLERNEEIEQLIPTEWRVPLVYIVEDICHKNLQSKKFIQGFEVEVDDIDHIYQSIDSYGDKLISLPPETWNTSICRWMGDHWHIMIDLFTEKDGLSDLVLFLNAFDLNDTIRFNILTVHVP